MFSRILVAINGTAQCQKVLQLVTRVAADSTRIHLVCVISEEYTALTQGDKDASPAADQEQTRVENILAQANEYLLTHNFTCISALVKGIPETAIPKYAQENHCDLIIMGHHHMTTFDRLVGNSVAHVVLENAHCPVLIEVR